MDEYIKFRKEKKTVVKKEKFNTWMNWIYFEFLKRVQIHRIFAASNKHIGFRMDESPYISNILMCACVQ